MNPSTFPWWEWLFIALGAWVFCGMCYLVYDYNSDRNKSVVVSASLSFASGLIAGICSIIAIIRFVKWVWVG